MPFLRFVAEVWLKYLRDVIYLGLTVMENLEIRAFLHTNKEENAALLKESSNISHDKRNVG